MPHDFIITVCPNTSVHDMAHAMSTLYPAKGWHTDGIDYVVPNVQPSQVWDAYEAAREFDTFGIKVIQTAYISPA